MNRLVLAAGIALGLTGAAVGEVKTASTPVNPALAITVPGPDHAAQQTPTRTAAVGASLPDAADPSRSTPGAAVGTATGTSPAPARSNANSGKPDVSISCVPNELKAVLREIERRWGDVQIISGYRKGATIRGTGKPSKHATCEAVDFKPAPGTYNAVARWLKETHNGGVGTYSGHFHHIHIDVGPKLSWHN